jgi:hypothetical protein
MKTRLLSLALLLAVGCTSGSTVVTTGPTDTSVTCPHEGEELETAMLFIEHNAADQDTGVHGNVGGEAWTQLMSGARPGHNSAFGALEEI